MSSESREIFYELLRTQRAVRRLRPDPIPDDVLARVMDAARYAPSGGNRQGWRMVMVTDADKKQRLGELYSQSWQGYRNQYGSTQGLSADAAAALVRTLDAGSYMAEHMHTYPLIAVVCFYPRVMAVTDAGLERVSVVGGGSVYPAVQNFMLACRRRRLGVRIDYPAVRTRIRSQVAALDSERLVHGGRRAGWVSRWSRLRSCTTITGRKALLPKYVETRPVGWPV